MKVNYRTHPILEKLYDGKLGRIPIDEKDYSFFAHKASAIFIETFKLYAPKFKNVINVVSSPFRQAALQAKDKLAPIVDELIENSSDFNFTGTFVFNDAVIMVVWHSKKNDEYTETALYAFDKIGEPVAMWIEHTSSLPEDRTIWLSKTTGIGQNEALIDAYVHRLLAEVMIVQMFKSYAQVEIKYLPAGQRYSNIGCKYINETKLGLTYLDSKWFTTLIKSDGFKVRGHFRLQPKKKDGKWTRELIYIEEFMKTGYTAPARKLNVQ